MKLLTNQGFDLSAQYIINNARYLEKILLDHHFIVPCGEKIVKALQMYQNKDGGYGNALEPDFRLPHSSALATSIALRFLKMFDEHNIAEVQIHNAIRYLESTFNKDISGWEAVPKMVNIYPHAPWWHRVEDVDYISGNPSAELVGYLYAYKSYVTSLDVDELIEFYVSRFEGMKQFEEHEVYCYIRLYEILPKEYKMRMLANLRVAYNELVSLDRDSWKKYVPYPLKFIGVTEESIFVISDEDLEENLNYLIDEIQNIGMIQPTWSWTEYEAEWEVAKREWTGILTLDALLILKRFNRLEKTTLQKK